MPDRNLVVLVLVIVALAFANVYFKTGPIGWVLFGAIVALLMGTYERSRRAER